MMKKKQSIIALVLAAIVTVLLGWTMIKGWGPTGTGSMKNINLGLDLSGGVSITYQVMDDNPTDEEMSDTVVALQIYLCLFAVLLRTLFQLVAGI